MTHETMESPGKVPAWLDLKLSLGNLLMVVTAIFGFGAYNSSIRSRLDALQAQVTELTVQLQATKDQLERRDVGEMRAKAITDRLDRLERKIDAIR